MKLKKKKKSWQSFLDFNYFAFFLFCNWRENITAWSSGTGASGIVAAMLYSILRKYLETPTTILIMLYVPVAQAIAFWILLIHPDKNSSMISIVGGNEKIIIKPPKKTMSKKISLLKKLWIYCIPLGLVYLFEFFINTGLVSCKQFIHFSFIIF